VAAVQELPEKCRQVFVLSRFRGMRHKEVAQRCGISTRMVEKHLTRGMALIRQKVGQAS
jgi:RNA polymerase sigma-70 factor (ECF subfamily)